jgi:hypothetical protein
MHSRTILRCALLASALPLVTGCGLLFVNGPPDNHRDLTSFDCTESRVAPALDLIIAGSSFLDSGADGESSAPDPGYYGTPYTSAYAPSDNTGNILSAIFWGASGAVGLSRVSACREAKRELQERLSGGPSESEMVQID